MNAAIRAWMFVLVSVGGLPFMSSFAGGHEPVLPIPPSPEVDPRKRALGERLFFEPLLSEDGKASCASCHDLSGNGAGHEALTAVRPEDTPVFNTPTVFNAALNAFQFWDGRADSLERQIDFVVEGPSEFNTTWSALLDRLRRHPEYRRLFEKTYPDGITAANVRDAIVTFEKTLLTPDSRFDRWMKGEKDVLTEEERRGYRLFKRYGCTACHQGVNLGGNVYQKLGIFEEYFKPGGEISRADLGRFNVTGREADQHVFRVPSLRNVAVTAPYFHDGSVETLEEVVALVGRYQLGRTIPQTDVRAIVAFLKTLTGRYRGRSLDEPAGQGLDR